MSNISEINTESEWQQKINSRITDLTVLMKDINCDVAKEATKQLVAFKRSVVNVAGPVTEIILTNDCVSVTCLSLRQKTTLLNTVM